MDEVNLRDGPMTTFSEVAGKCLRNLHFSQWQIHDFEIRGPGAKLLVVDDFIANIAFTYFKIY